ncbi:MAG: lysine--tRNA ligase [Acidobacteria bacterium]|nr:MAG: lysine--tRNA ligase [Acidobacteriota bacterium]
MEPLEQIRIQKLPQIKDLGVDPYPTYYRYTHTLGEVVKQFSVKTVEELDESHHRVRIAGRILTNRPFGKAGFLTLSDGEGQLQVYVKKDRLPERDFQLYKLLDIGDFIGVEGTLFRTKTGELTVLAGELTFLAKCFLPLPEKWHGLKDIEIRYRQRYIDLVVNREVREVFVQRGVIIRELRKFLDDRDYLEVETPILHPIAGGALAKPFKTHHNALDMSLYLRIAPELYLKRLIVGGLNRVYDLNRIFRNEGISTRHNPEFTMLEFYQAYSNYTDLMDLTEEMLTGIAEKVRGTRVITFDEQQIDFSKWTRFSMKEAILKFCAEGITEEQLKDRATIERLLKQLHADFDPRLPIGNLIGLLFETVAEEHLIQPTFIYDYPIELSPLSKQKASDPSLVERFLNDPMDQRERFLSQLRERERGDEEAHQMDEDYIRALSYGMPPTAGEGIGVDRLTMLLTNSASIRDVILFPHLRAE